MPRYLSHLVEETGEILFLRIARQIKLVFILSVALCTGILSIISFIAIRRNTIRNFMQLAAQYTIEQQNNFALHLDHVMNNAANLLISPDIKARLRSSRPNSELDIATINQLTYVQSSDLDITAITLYSTDGSYRQSQSNRLEPYTPPPLKQLLTNPALAAFLHSERQAMWFTRHKGNSIPEDIVYYYRLQGGVYTLVLKVKDSWRDLPGDYDLGAGTSGILLIDVDLSTVFSKIFYNTSEIETCIITSDDKALPSESSSLNFVKTILSDLIRKDRINRGPFISKNRQVILTITKLPRSSDRIALAVRISPINLQLMLIAFLLLLIGSGLIVVAFLVGDTVAKSIVIPLTDLYQKMKN